MNRSILNNFSRDEQNDDMRVVHVDVLRVNRVCVCGSISRHWVTSFSISSLHWYPAPPAQATSWRLMEAAAFRDAASFAATAAAAAAGTTDSVCGSRDGDGAVPGR